ncbi:Sodium:neurotransmitter symporter family protein [Colletotrichum limetticola]|uniref:Sodium:neurotransmitter symporter family protein n=1 Tax=Colletotrichum limetticola TaxID=1209924 RepID=A0ABQ9Q9W4_9PEZI|nr:Sodium:neurotransmitter symporter family protein [Colletotrichum limetticola]
MVGFVIAHAMSPKPVQCVPVFGYSLQSIPSLSHTQFQGNQLRRDLNAIISIGGKWKISVFWGFVLKYNTAPIVAIIFSFPYPNFYAKNRMDPLHIAGFALKHIVLVSSLVALIMPHWFNVLVPNLKKLGGHYPVMPGIRFLRANAEGTLDIDGMPHNAHGMTLKAQRFGSRRNLTHQRSERCSSKRKITDKRQ